MVTGEATGLPAGSTGAAPEAAGLGTVTKVTPAVVAAAGTAPCEGWAVGSVKVTVVGVAAQAVQTVTVVLNPGGTAPGVTSAGQ